jgi:thiamine pyrophosphokinase
VDTVVIFAGGGKPVARRVRGVAAAASFVIAADSGADYALALGQRIDLAVGDFDSISADGLATLERTGVRLERHPTEKDATDLELALNAAAGLQPRRIVVVGGTGGRLDHVLGVLSLLAADAYRDVELDALLGRATVHVVRRERRLAGRVGGLISLLALHGPARGVLTEGLAYALNGETLMPGSTLGMSNEFASPQAHIAVESGVLLAVRPN